MTFRSLDNYFLLAAFYDRFIGEAYYKRLGELFEQLIEGADPENTLVDIGCGTGWLLERASERRVAPTGVDVSPAMLAVASERCPSAEMICASFSSIHGRQWNYLTANNDVFNHLVYADGMSETLAHFAEIILPGGAALFDAVSEFDVLHNWEGCRHRYSDEHNIRCDVSHTVSGGSVPIGSMRRVWSQRRDEDWVIIGEEREDVIGISPASILTAARAVGVSVELFDWDRGGQLDDNTSRIGAWLFR